MDKLLKIILAIGFSLLISGASCQEKSDTPVENTPEVDYSEESSTDQDPQIEPENDDSESGEESSGDY